MKKILFILFLGMLFFSCESKKENESKKLNITNDNLNKANTLIENYLRDTLMGNMEFSNNRITEIDTITEIDYLDSIKSILIEIDSVENKFDSLYSIVKVKNYIFKGDDMNYNKDILLLTNYFEIMFSEAKIAGRLFKNSNRKLKGWRIRYEYEIIGTKNYKKAIWDTFIINSEFTRIINYFNNDYDNDFYFNKIMDNLDHKINQKNFYIILLKK